MQAEHFDALAPLLGLDGVLAGALYDVLVEGDDPTDVASACDLPLAEVQAGVARLQAADHAIRAAYVVHQPMEFRVLVGHGSSDRWPGSRQLALEQTVRLVARTTERWIPVRITALPATPAGYYRGVITQQLVPSSQYQVGNSVLFSEDQVS